jgi:transcriptional regulator
MLVRKRGFKLKGLLTFKSLFLLPPTLSTSIHYHVFLVSLALKKRLTRQLSGKTFFKSSDTNMSMLRKPAAEMFTKSSRLICYTFKINPIIKRNFCEGMHERIIKMPSIMSAKVNKDMYVNMISICLYGCVDRELLECLLSCHLR